MIRNFPKTIDDGWSLYQTKCCIKINHGKYKYTSNVNTVNDSSCLKYKTLKQFIIDIVVLDIHRKQWRIIVMVTAGIPFIPNPILLSLITVYIAIFYFLLPIDELRTNIVLKYQNYYNLIEYFVLEKNFWIEDKERRILYKLVFIVSCVRNHKIKECNFK